MSFHPLLYRHFIFAVMWVIEGLFWYEIILWIPRKMGWTRRRGVFSIFTDWSLHKLFPTVNWPDDFGEFRRTT